MSFKETIKRVFLPARALRQDMHVSEWHILDAIGALEGNLNHKVENVLMPEIDMVDSHMQTFFWQLYRNEGELTDDAKKRFFKELPQATGAMRVYQLACAKLLGEFDAFCQEHQLAYWLDYGSLLGAVRHGGYIPWDDDMDLCMMRADAEALIAAAADDERYQVTVAYDRDAFCRQLRFKYADDSIPCFIDVFAYDAIADADKATLGEMACKHAELLNQLGGIACWKEQALIAAGEPGADEIAAVFDAAVTDMAAEGDAVVLGIDGGSWAPKYAYAADEVFPLQRGTFEGVECNIPANPEAVLARSYGDIMKLPADMGTHFAHVSDEALKDFAAQQ